SSRLSTRRGEAVGSGVGRGPGGPATGLRRVDQQVRAGCRRHRRRRDGMGGVHGQHRAPPGPAFLAGASGQVTVAAGLGANVLIGGSNNTNALQPGSVAPPLGLHFSLLVAGLPLRPPPPPLLPPPPPPLLP